MTDGRILLPNRADPEPMTGPTGAWCDYSGGLDGARTGDPWSGGVTIFNHPDNDPHPIHWFTMTEPFGSVSANPTWGTVHSLQETDSVSWTWGCGFMRALRRRT